MLGWPCRGRRVGLGVLLLAPARRGWADRQSHPASTQPSPSTQPWRAEVWHSSGADSRGAGQAGSPAPCSSPAFDSAAPAGRPAHPGWRGPPQIPYNTDPAPDKLPQGSVPPVPPACWVPLSTRTPSVPPPGSQRGVVVLWGPVATITAELVASSGQLAPRRGCPQHAEGQGRLRGHRGCATAATKPGHRPRATPASHVPQGPRGRALAPGTQQWSRWPWATAGDLAQGAGAGPFPGRAQGCGRASTRPGSSPCPSRSAPAPAGALPSRASLAPGPMLLATTQGATRPPPARCTQPQPGSSGSSPVPSHLGQFWGPDGPRELVVLPSSSHLRRCRSDSALSVPAAAWGWGCETPGAKPQHGVQPGNGVSGTGGCRDQRLAHPGWGRGAAGAQPGYLESKQGPRDLQAGSDGRDFY